MRSSPPPPQPSRPEKSQGAAPAKAAPSSSRPKESSFLKSIGLELSSFGFGGSSSSSAKKAAPAPAKSAPSPVVEGRRSHRPAPKAPGKQSESSFPGVKLRSRETLLPPSKEEELNDQDFDDLTVLLETGSDAPSGPPSKAEEEDDVLLSDLSKLSSDDLEKNLLRMSLSELPPTDDAPAPPPTTVKKKIKPAPEEPMVDAPVAVEALADVVPPARLPDPVIVTVEVPVKDSKAEEALSAAMSQLEAAKEREADLEARLAEMERLSRQAEADSKNRIQELEMQLDALVREKESRNETSSSAEAGPTREELLAAIDAYRGKLAETDQELQKSEERKNNLRDDLRKLITKSKEIEGNAKSWKERAESFESKFTKTKALAREYAERCKALEKEKKDRAATAAPSTVEGESEDLKAQLVALDRRAKKAEEMAKLAVGVIKKSGSSELRKELAVALQGLQQASVVGKVAATAEAKSDRRKSPREPMAKVEVEEQPKAKSEDKVPVIKSPRVEAVVTSVSSTSFLSPQVGRKQKVESSALGSKTPTVERKKEASLSPASSPPPKQKEAFTRTESEPGLNQTKAKDGPLARTESEPKLLLQPPTIKSPRQEELSSSSSSGSAFLSPQVDRKKQFVVASAGGSKTPTVLRKKEAEAVIASPSVQRRNNPGRSERVQPAQPAAKKTTDSKVESSTNSAVVASLDGGSGTDDAFALLEGMLKEVEKETGQTGLSGPVDNSHVFESSGDASSYLASMKQEASAEQMAMEKEKARKAEELAQSKRDAQLAASNAARDAHRNLLFRYLEEESNYIEAQLKDPLHPAHSLLCLLNRNEKLQSETTRNQLLDEAADVDFLGSELVLRVQLIEARDLGATLTDVSAVLSVSKQHESSSVLSQLPSSGVAQWNESFLFSPVDASSRLTVTLMSKKSRLGVAQIQLRELRGTGKEYYPIVDNSAASGVIRGMMTAAVSLHFRFVKKNPVVVKLDPNSKSYQDAVRHNVLLIKKCEENKPREREFNASVKLTALQKEMDQPKPNLAWLAQQLRAGHVRGDDPFESVYRRTLLHLMVIAGDVEMVELCLAHGADPKKRDCFGLLPFHLAIVYGHLKMLQNMLPVMRAFGQSVHTPENAAGLTPVHLAAIFNRAKILEWLLDQGAEVDDKDDFGALPLHKAAFVGSLGCAQALVNRRAFVKAEDIDGNTPLLLAMKEGHWDVADYLLTNNVHKADLDTVNLAGETALWCAVSRSNRRFTRLCLDSPHCVSTLSSSFGPNGWSILMRALFELEDEAGEEVVKLLAEAMVSRGLGLNQRAVDGKTAAFVACFKGKYGLLKWLAGRGLDLLCQDDNANTCFHYCGTIQVAEVLLQAGVNVNSKNHQGNTPLHAAYAFHPEVVDFLISQGAANANIRNNGNIRPIEAAMLSSSSKIEMAYDAPVQNKQTCGLTIK